MMQYRHIPTRMAQMKNTENPVCEDVKHLEASWPQVERVKSGQLLIKWKASYQYPLKCDLCWPMTQQFHSQTFTQRTHSTKFRAAPFLLDCTQCVRHPAEGNTRQVQ